MLPDTGSVILYERRSAIWYNCTIYGLGMVCLRLVDSKQTEYALNGP